MAPSKLFKQTRKDARRDPAAAHQLARWYVEGLEGLEQDTSLWIRWEREAAERGCADAQNAMGVAHRKGRFAHLGVERNLEKAREWFRKASLQGQAESSFTLGVMFDSGEGVVQNYATAVSWLRKAVSQGDVLAMVRLGVMLREGRPGVEQDCQASVELNLKAVEGGSVPALWNLGLEYFRGVNGVLEKNVVTALSYCQRAADLGQAQAAEVIGKAYWSGAEVVEGSRRICSSQRSTHGSAPPRAMKAPSHT